VARPQLFHSNNRKRRIMAEKTYPMTLAEKEKLEQELEELKNELMKEDKQRSTEELGDFLFSLINAARLYHLNPDNALEHTNQKFIKRFNYIEEKAREKGVNIKDLTLEEMDKFWEEAKQTNK